MNSQIDDYIQHAKQTHKGCLFVISGPSGAGKGTLVKEVLPMFDNLSLSISMTTRLPRNNEEHGVNYFFVEREKFQNLIHEEAFLEYATYNGNYYGTPKGFVWQQLDVGQDIILEIDVQGAMQIKANCPSQTVQIFILPPSQADLKHRLEQRKTESAEVIQQRLDQVAKEMAQLPGYDYFIINDQLDRATHDLAAIIRAERLKIRS